MLNQKRNKKVDNTIKLLQKKCEFSGHGTLVTCCAFLSKNYLISGSDDSDILLWDFEKPGRYLVKFSDHEFELQCLDVFKNDGNIVASGANDATVRIWDIRMKQPCFRVFDKN
jgi:WD40 repeat protein